MPFDRNCEENSMDSYQKISFKGTVANCDQEYCIRSIAVFCCVYLSIYHNILGLLPVASCRGPRNPSMGRIPVAYLLICWFIWIILQSTPLYSEKFCDFELRRVGVDKRRICNHRTRLCWRLRRRAAVFFLALRYHNRSSYSRR